MVGSISIKDDIKRATRRLNDIEKRQIPFATALAMTWSAQDAQKKIIGEMPRVFDRPTRFTLKGTEVRPAKKRDWPNLSASVEMKGFSNAGTRGYISTQVKGGARRHKPFELSLISAGQMPSNMYAVPAKRLRLNRFGNVSRGLHTKVLSALRATLGDTFQHAKADATVKFFALPKGRGKLPAGIWERKGSGKTSFITLVFAYVRAPRYRKRLRFWRIAENTVRQRMPINFRRAFRQAVKTAR